MRLLSAARIHLTVMPLTYVVIAVIRLVDPNTIARSPVGQSFGTLTLLWHLWWLVGGALVVAGRARRQRELERIGLPLLAGGWLMAAFATVVAQGIDGYLLLYAVLLGWAYDRARHLHRTAPRR